MRTPTRSFLFGGQVSSGGSDSSPESDGAEQLALGVYGDVEHVQQIYTWRLRLTDTPRRDMMARPEVYGDQALWFFRRPAGDTGLSATPFDLSIVVDAGQGALPPGAPRLDAEACARWAMGALGGSRCTVAGPAATAMMGDIKIGRPCIWRSRSSGVPRRATCTAEARRPR